MDYGGLRDHALSPQHTGQPADLTDDPRRGFLRTVPCQHCDGAGTTEWRGEDWTCGPCDCTGNAPDAPVDTEPSAEHVAAIADCPAFRDAETAARAVAAALVPWGVEVPDRISWRIAVRKYPVAGDSFQTGLPGVVTKTLDAPLTGAKQELLDKAVPRDLGLGELWTSAPLYVHQLRRVAAQHARWVAAVRLDLAVPAAGPDGVAGRPVADVPNPFTPLLDVWRTGFLPERIDHTGMHLFAARRDAIVR
jgi:hypothetical protein